MAKNNMKIEKLHKELDFIQGVITRMANNSFLLKGWLISLIAVVLALNKDSLLSNEINVYIILLLPIITFWYLDAFFLHREKLYRKLYEWVITNRPSNKDHLYSLNAERFKNQVESIFCVMLSITLRTFYGIPFIFLIGLIIYKISING
jgi:hypothetical protein